MSDSVSRKEFEDLRKKVDSMSTGSKKERKKRAPTLYNKFVGQKSKELRSKKPSLTQKEAFSKAIDQWKKLSDKEKEDFSKSLSVEEVEDEDEE